jgi:hypothetical protein
MQPSPDSAATHLHGLCVAGGQYAVNTGWIDSYQESALAAGGDCEPAGYEEGQSAEHRLFVYFRGVGQLLSDPVN